MKKYKSNAITHCLRQQYCKKPIMASLCTTSHVSMSGRSTTKKACR